MTGSVAIWWVRRDLRLSDHPALTAALRHGAVVPVFVLDPILLRSRRTAPKRLAFLVAGLHHLDAALRARGSRLVVRTGDPAEVLARLVGETGAVAVYAQEDASPYARARDERVARRVPLRLTGGLTVHPLGLPRRPDGSPYTVYTRFRNAWLALPLSGRPLPAPPRIPTPDLPSEPIPRADPPGRFPPGEEEALRRLRAFTEGEAAPIYRYAVDRNRLDLAGTSGLSPYLRFGMLSPRVALDAALRAMAHAPNEASRQSAEVWRDELVWREFFLSILFSFPHMREVALREELRRIEWENDEAAFTAWCEGRTGYPVVDAAMRELRETGWMHNRARMIVASFLAKDLLVDWRWGELHFMRCLVDGDPAANSGGWQWSAGVGTDAAPYFRIFNPVRQGVAFDPEGHYVRRWVPELARVPAPYVHAPWLLPRDDQIHFGCRVGVDYPKPVVDHAQARRRALQRFAQARRTP